jgi:hypothetical protein
LYYIGILQVGGTAAALHRRSAATNFSTGVYPLTIGMVHATGGMSSLPASFIASDMSAGTKFWGALGTATAPTAPGQLSYADSFTRADSTSLGSAWNARQNSGLRISYNTAGRQVGGNGALSTYVSRMATNNHKVGAVWTSVPTSSTSGSSGTGSTRRGTTSGITQYTDRGLVLWLRGNGSGGGVYARVTGSLNAYATIYQASSYTNPGSTFEGATPRSSYTYLGIQGVEYEWEFRASGNNYILSREGVDQLTWTDGGGLYSVGSSNTEVGVGVWGADNTYAGVDDWFARDL